MPEWCFNEVVVMGNKKDLKKFRDLFAKNSDTFSYNCVIRMPESLNIPAGSERDMAILYYLYTISGGNIFKVDPKIVRTMDSMNKWGLLTTKGKFRMDAEKHFEVLVEKLKKYVVRYSVSGGECKVCPRIISTREEFLQYGKTLIDNKLKYNAEHWYDWAIDNWGVKWDASDVSEFLEGENELSFTFMSPWTFPDKVLIALSKKFPTLTFILSAETDPDDVYTLIYKKGKFEETKKLSCIKI